MAKTFRRGIGKISAAATVIAMVVIVIGIGGFFGSQGPPVTLSVPTATSTIESSSSASSTQSTCTAGATIEEIAGLSTPPCGCALVDSTSGGSLYLSSDPSVGNNVCIEADLVGTSQVYLSITNSTGSVVFSYTCVATSQTSASSAVSSSAATAGAPSSGISCLDFWNTANPNARGVAVAGGAYRLTASDSSSPSSPAVLEANFILY